MPIVTDELEQANKTADAEREREWADATYDHEALRADIAKNFDPLFREAEIKQEIEETQDLQRQISDRYGAPVGDVVKHFLLIDGEMRKNPSRGMTLAQEMFQRNAGDAIISAKDFEPIEERDIDARLAATEKEQDADLRAALAKNFRLARQNARSTVNLYDAVADMPGSLEKGLKRILALGDTGAKNPQLAAAQWVSTTIPGETEKFAREQFVTRLHGDLNQALDDDFSDLNDHIDEIAEMFQSGRLKSTGDVRHDLGEARKLIKPRKH
ncbi:MAG: hypothetical protein BGN87_11535 [Rhizobiales bacterium 65-79]|mgnify:CR=1 FL=1|jgi:hypothetical protein|nr:hypothetical protein [Hyphomicrobiales bacterium]OJU07143.1 MAG: hypothetical protein BGN87_11535 [Rhizobiales bacterium 65-79]